jgi:DNA-binding NtrC family response regulator
MKNRHPDETVPINLLLVDDEEGFVSVLSKRLKKRNIVVTPALSGSIAIEKFRAERFDVVLLDLKMEFMDGIEVLKALKEMDPSVPVVMITGHGSTEEARRCLDHGAVDCLPKPYDFDRVVETIRGVLNGTEPGNG